MVRECVNHQPVRIFGKPRVDMQEKKNITACSRRAGIHLRCASAWRLQHTVRKRAGKRDRAVAAAAVDHNQFDAAPAQRRQCL